MKKRIMVIVEYFPPRLGGDRRIFELMKRLNRKYEVHFMVLPPSYTLFIKKSERYTGGKDRFFHCGMMGHRLNIPRPIWKIWTYTFLPAFAITLIYLSFELISKIAELRPHIIIVDHTSAYTGLLGFISSKLMNKRLLVEYNDLQALYTFELVKGKLDRRLLGILGRTLVLIEDTIVRHGWRVTAITSFIKNYAEARNTRRDIVVIPDGVDSSFFDPVRTNGKRLRSKYGIGDGEILCVYTGRIDRCAGGEIILETANLLVDRENIRFLIVGEGDPHLVKELSNHRNVILTGLVPREHIPEYLAGADLVLVPFPNNIASHSISPLKLFEGLAMEKPVIASAVSGIKDVIADDFSGILVSPDPKEWAYAITQLAGRSEDLVLLGERGRQVVCREYDWENLAERFGSVIEGTFPDEGEK